MDINTLLAQLKNHTTVLTPNRRLAATLLKQYNQQQKELGRTTWDTADILPLSSWVERLMQSDISQSFAPTPLLLKSPQEKILWEDIVRRSPQKEFLLRLSETADLAQSAWTLLKQWQLPLDHPELNVTEDSQIFLTWAAAFEMRCKKNGWIDTASLIDYIALQIQENRIMLPDSIVAIGFTQLSPQQKNLLSACGIADSRITITDLEVGASPPTLRRIGMANESTEIRSMARWAKALHDLSPESSIGCIVPHLEKNREAVLRIFRDIFSDPHILHLDHLSLPFNISAGTPLSRYPVIQAALRCLSLEKKVIHSLGDSPFIKTIETWRIDVELKRPISEWVTLFTERLTQCGWPGERSLNSQEYQTVQRWLSVCQDYQSYDLFLSACTHKEALHYLNRLTSQIMFQVQSVDAPVQLLGMLEAAGLPFDHVWVMGLDDSNWPPIAKPHPFIPHALQKALQMPQSSSEREYQYSVRLLDQLKKSTPHLTVSYSTQNTEIEARPSPLTLDIPEVSLSTLALSDDLSPIQAIFNSRDVEYIVDKKAPPVGEQEKIRGGASILKKQAACAFRAFAEIRLHAKPIEPPVLGLHASEKGKITHLALELIWKTLQNSSILHKTDGNALNHLLHDSVAIAIKTVTGKDNANSRYIQLETDRQIKLLHEWMMVEKNRPDFKVKQLEYEQFIAIGPLTLRCRIDRVDTLSNGSHFIIDYKTGKNNSIYAWFGERPDEPQLPLYCLTDPSCTSMAFSEIQAKAVAFKGISKHDVKCDNIKPIEDWDAQTAQWKNTLERLSHDFYNGEATIDPKNGKQTCERCHCQSLCRIHEIIA